MNEVQQGNIDIALFLGYEYYPWNSGSEKPFGWRKPKKPLPQFSTKFPYFLGRRHSDLRFSNDWNWLMLCVAAIEKSKENITVRTQDRLLLKELFPQLRYKLEEADISKCFNIIIQIIKILEIERNAKTEIAQCY
jgi:hypothetical protein